MILRRLTYAIREQNWFALALELVVVVRRDRSPPRTVDPGVTRPPSEYLSLAHQETLCRSHKFLLGIALLTAFCESSVYNFGEWTRVLTTGHELAEAENR